MTNNQLVVADAQYMPIMNIADAKRRYQAFKDFVESILRPGVDYGVIPGTQKPTLLKPGAEKLLTFFGLTVHFEVSQQIQDWTGDARGGEPFFYFWYRCTLTRNGQFVADAEGSCNSHEKKYRWRDGQRKCPQCGAAAIIKGRPEYGGGWVCFAKKGGCGAKFREDDTAITGQQTGRVPNEDIADTVNTIQKMAQKRALVAAALIGTNASDYFTQDAEDYIDGDFVPAPEEKRAPAAEEVKRPDAKQPAPPETAESLAKFFDSETKPPAASPAPAHAPATSPKTNGSPRAPEAVRRALVETAKKTTGEPKGNMLAQAVLSLNVLANDNETKRHQLTEFMFGKGTKFLSAGECLALMTWIDVRTVDGKKVAAPMALQEANAILATVAELAA